MMHHVNTALRAVGWAGLVWCAVALWGLTAQFTWRGLADAVIGFTAWALAQALPTRRDDG